MASANQHRSILQSQIRDLGDQIDTHKTKLAGAVGGAVFTFLLAAGGAYDLLEGKTSLWSALGLSSFMFRWLVAGLAVISVWLIAVSLRLERRRDRSLDSRLLELQQELEDVEDTEFTEHPAAPH